MKTATLRRTLRLIHCLQKERGATCTASVFSAFGSSREISSTKSDYLDSIISKNDGHCSSIDEGEVDDWQASVEDADYYSRERHARLIAIMFRARSSTDVALAQLLSSSIANNMAGFYLGEQAMPLKESLQRVRSIFPGEEDAKNKNSRDKIGQAAVASSASIYRRVFVAFNTLIANVIHDHIVIPHSFALKKRNSMCEGSSRARSKTISMERMGTFIAADVFHDASNHVTENRPRSVSHDEADKNAWRSTPIVSNVHRDDPEPVEKNCSWTSPLQSLLLAFVRLKESTGIERAMLSQILAMPQNNANHDDSVLSKKQKDEERLLNDLVLEIENQHQLIIELRQTLNILLENDELDGYNVLVSIVEQSVILSPELSNLHNLIKNDFNLEAFRKAVSLETFWSLITFYIDRLHGLELLIVEDIESSMHADHEYVYNKQLPPEMPSLDYSSPLKKRQYTLLEVAEETEHSDNISCVKLNHQDTFGTDLGLDLICAALGIGDAEHSSMFSQAEARNRLESLSPDELKSYILSLCSCNSGSNSNSSRKMLRRRESAPVILESTEANTEEWRIDLYDVKFIKRIGRGVAGTTYLGNWKGASVAIKVASLTETGIEGWGAEVRHLQRLHHPNIIRLLGSIVSKTPQTYCLVLEYCDAGDLNQVMKNPMPSDLFMHVAKSMANGMAYLHKRDILHRDIKPDNVLLHGDLKEGKYVVKLTDFGLSTIFLNSSDKELTAETGTYRWMAPEIIRHQPYSFKADVYSFAIVAWQLITREDPYQDVNQVQAAGMVAFENARPPFPKCTPNPIKELVESCWSENPLERPVFESICSSLKELEKHLSEDEKMWIQSTNGHQVYDIMDTHPPTEVKNGKETLNVETMSPMRTKEILNANFHPKEDVKQVQRKTLRKFFKKISFGR